MTAKSNSGDEANNKNVKHTKIIIMKRLFFISAIIVGLVSCEKEEVEVKSCSEQNNIENITVSENILIFKSMEDYDNKRVKTYNLSHTDRKKQEKEAGFISFGTYSNELYSKINPENTDDIERLKQYVEENAEYIQLIPEENGDFTYETRLFSSHDKYLLNKDGMYQIKDNVYKVFENGKASTNIYNINELKTMDEEIAKNLPSTSEIKYEAKISESITMKGDYCDTPVLDKRHTIGNYRLRGQLELKWQHYPYWNPSGTDVKSRMLIISYRKVGFIWWRAPRTITWDFQVEYSAYKQGGGFHSPTQGQGGVKNTDAYFYEMPYISITTSYKATGLCYNVQDLYAKHPDMSAFDKYYTGRKYK